MTVRRILRCVASPDEDRRAYALLELALQGDADIAAGRTVTRAEHKKRVAAVVVSRMAR